MFYTKSPAVTQIEYEEGYWESELESARDRAWGIALARTSEVFILARKEISNFVDIGSGPGYFLDAIENYLPDSSIDFQAIELYPPNEEFRTKHTGYKVGWLDSFGDGSLDAGICIEVLEHLTSSEVKQLFDELYEKASMNSLFIFNTGLTDYVRKEDHNYLDPDFRGHISIWSVNAIRRLTRGSGWKIREMPNRSWAFLAEKTNQSDDDLMSRIWSPVPQNISTLEGKLKSKVLYLLGRDSLRAI